MPRRTTIAAGLALTFVLLACNTAGSDDEPATTPVEVNSGRPVVLSSDMAMGLTTGSTNGTADSPSDYDDSWALALAAASGEFDIRGVVVTMGNNMVAPQMDAARATADALDLDIPVVAGASVWLPIAPMADYTGATMPETCINEGVEFLAEQLRALDELTIIAIGPLTDVACLVMNFPDEAARIGEVVALVGSRPDASFDFEGVTLRDFNYVMDPRAEQVVLESEVPFTAIMFEASSSAALSTDVPGELAASDNDLARFFGEASVPYAEFWNEKIAPVKPVWDANVVWYLMNPDHYVCGQSGYQLQTGAPLGGGDTPLSDWFSPDYTDTRQVTACDAFVDQAAMDAFDAAVLTAVGGP